jgi:hypothetical protein
MKLHCTRPALLPLFSIGFLVLLLPSAISVPLHAQDADFTPGTTPISRIVSADCTPMAVTRLTAEPDEEKLTSLAGNVHPLARAEFDRGAVPDDLPMEHIIMVLQRAPEQELALQARIDQMHNHQSALFHKWLSTEQVGSCYGVADTDIATISKWLVGKGFKVDSVPAGKTLLIFSGTAGLVRDAFHTEMHYLNVNGKPHIANMSAPQIPAAFAPVVAGFRSLHDFFPKPTMRPLGLVKRDPRTGKTYLADDKKSSPLNKLALKSKGGPDVAYTSEDGQFVGPQDFFTIYNENPLLNGKSCSGAACNGAGQSIGVIEETDVCDGQSGTSPDDCAGANDLTAFRTQFGLPAANVTYMFGITSYCGDPGVQGPSGTGEEGEADLDLQWAGAVAPGAALYFVACANSSSSSGVDLAATYAVNNLAPTLSSFSVSYGLCESQLPEDGFGAPSFYNGLWEQAAAQGQTVVVSAGDSGDDTCDRGALASTSGWNVNGIASTPYDVVAGGTDFTDVYSSGDGYFTSGVGGPYWNTNDTSPYGSALGYIPETTWNGTCASTLETTYISAEFGTLYTPEEFCNGDTADGLGLTGVGPGGGGGISSVFSKPTWQNAYGVGLSTNYTSSTMRNLPDLSMFASNGIWNHALLSCESDISTGTGGGTPCVFSNVDEGGMMAAGGTSYVAPQINGLIAVINQAHPSGNPAQPTRQGQANYTFYALAAHEYGTPAAENVSTTAPSVLTCESNYLTMAEYSSVFPSCVFYDINRTPLIEFQECSGTTNTDCVVDGNQMPCVTGDPNCYTATSTDAYGILSTSTSSSEPAFHQSAGYSDATGLGSVNIANLVANWNSSTWITQFSSSTALATSAASITTSGSVTLTATVTATGRGGTVSPAGVVEFFIGSTSGTLLGTVPMTHSCTGSGTSTSCEGVASFTVTGSGLNAGSNSIIAYFEGDGANDAPSTSAAQTVTVTGESDAPAALTTPTPGVGTKLGTTDVTFEWTTGTGVTEYQLDLGTVAGASNLFLYKGTATSAIASTLPANDVVVYATLYSKINGVWESNAYEYTEAGTPTPAALTSPTPGVGTILGTNNVQFQWNAGIAVTDYELTLSAIAAGDSELFSYKGTALTATATSLPADGVKVYARLYSKINGVWEYNDYQYTEGGTPTPAALTNPTPGVGTILGTSNVQFQWNAGIAVAEYQLNLSAVAAGDSELFLYKGTALTATATSLPANGVTVYARLYSKINGVWQYNDYQYTEGGTPTPATLTSPAPGVGTVLGTSNVKFQWTAGIAVTDYQLNLSAVAAGDSELFLYKGTALTATATSLPANGVKVYARLYSKINGVWQYNDYVYTEQ